MQNAEIHYFVYTTWTAYTKHNVLLVWKIREIYTTVISLIP